MKPTGHGRILLLAFRGIKPVPNPDLLRFPLFLALILASVLLAACGRKHGEMLAITHVNLVPMTQEMVLKNQSVLIEDGQITAVGDADQMQVPRGIEVIDGHGAYLMPGLADMHVHTRQEWDDQTIWPVNPLHLYLANGVTTIRDFGPAGTPLTYALNWREEINAGERVGPTILASGEILYASPIEDPQGIVQKNYEDGFDFLKLYSYLSDEDFQAAIATAKSLELYTAGHIPFPIGLEGVLGEGLDEIAHVEELLFEFFEFDREKELDARTWLKYIIQSISHQLDPSSAGFIIEFQDQHREELAQISSQLRSAGVPLCTTMVVDDVIQWKLFQPEAFLAREESQYFEAGYSDQFLLGQEKHQVQCRGIEALCAAKYNIDLWILEGLHENGVTLLLGSDSGTGGMGIVPGFSIHDELQILVENGFTPYEALVTGTVNAAEIVQRMGRDGNFGTIEVGKRADLILVNDNPLENNGTIRRPLGVITAGRWYSQETLDNLINLAGNPSGE